MSTDRLTEKLESMDKRRELRARRVSLTEALEILSDLRDAGDGKEAARWHEFVMNAHARGDFRWTFELNRREWSAVMHGRVMPCWSQLEMELASQRFALGSSDTWRRSDGKAGDPMPRAILDEMKRAGNEGRLMTGPHSGVIKGSARLMFRSMTDPLRDETPEDMSAALDRKIEILEAAAVINEAIDAILLRVAARLANGEAVLPTATTLALLEDTINRVASIPSGAFGTAPSIDGRVRLTDGVIPKWGELLRAYEDVWSKVADGRVNRAVTLTRSLEAVWNRDDEEARVLAEKTVASPDPLTAELLAVERGLNSSLFVR